MLLVLLLLLRADHGGTKLPCWDETKACETYTSLGFCQDTRYTIVRTKYCRKTCGACWEDSCEDAAGIEYCEILRTEGLCWLPGVSASLVSDCAKTCGNCRIPDFRNKSICGNSSFHMPSPPMSGQLIGGIESIRGSWPWQVGLYQRSRFVCGGTLINERYVLTAAHCVIGMEPGNLHVVLGDTIRHLFEGNEVKVQSKRIRTHEAYYKPHHDIALIQLSRKIRYNRYIAPVCLPPAGERPEKNDFCFVTGWGKTSVFGRHTDVLQQTHIPLVPFKRCRRRNSLPTNGRQVTYRMLCGGYDYEKPTSSCHGDSGGPLVCMDFDGLWYIQGIVSWGSPRCNSQEGYSVFTRVESYLDWIYDVTEPSNANQVHVSSNRV